MNTEKWDVIKRNMEREIPVTINVHYAQSAGSDLGVMAKIEDAIRTEQPFGLKCETSSVVFIPQELKAYWIGAEQTSVQYRSAQAFVDGVKMQYLSHKEFVSTQRLLEFVKLL